MNRLNSFLIILIIFSFFHINFSLTIGKSIEERVSDLEKDSIAHYKEIIQRISDIESDLKSIINQKELKSTYLKVSGFKFVLSGLVLWSTLLFLIFIKFKSTTLTSGGSNIEIKKEWIEEFNNTDPYLNLILQLILPGLGHLYIGQKKKGIILISQYIYLCFFNFIYLNILTDMIKTDQDLLLILISLFVFLILFSFFILFYISSILDFFQISNRLNKKYPILIGECYNQIIFLLIKSFLNDSFHFSSPPSFWNEKINKYQIGEEEQEEINDEIIE
eukprot:gene5392-9205_t